MCVRKMNEVVHLEIENRNDENGKREMDTRDMIYRIAHRIASELLFVKINYVSI